MKLSVLLCTILLLAAAAPVFAQSNAEDVDMVQSAFGKDKKALMSAYLQVPAKDSVAFWKLYDEYESKRKELGKKRISLLQDYAAQYNNLSSQEATKLAESSFSNDGDYTSLYKSYFKKFSGVLGGVNAAKMFQLEVYLQTRTRLAIMENIPFIGELNSQQKAPNQ
ncbi:hypothetical protein [Deminuibacter soli]|uniref:Uncharacterized protein n=1 Tax=Deminuibacter soli TaxID=2291815 RepID=A0A3E1NH70_9BACT|nr:hypothetical protein [Deminuibacter soli]RFM27306.1 hypothetical protein DXN05_14860 [Deminuibacter soli]